MAIYAVSDIHGQYDIFLQGLNKIGFSKNDRLYLVGDAVDRGPKSIPLLMHIMKAENMDMVLGNHEFMMLNSVDHNGITKCSGKDTMLWLFYNGGSTTFDGYKKLPREERIELINWLMSRKLSHHIKVDTGNGDMSVIFTHSGYDPEYLDVPYSDINYKVAKDIVWKSMFREDTYCDSRTYTNFPDTVFITGHVPIQRIRDDLGQKQELLPYRYKNLLNIDGGLAYGNSVDNNGAIFLRLEDLQVTTV